MNKINFASTAGGVQIVLTDFEFIQDALSEVLHGLMKGIVENATENIIIYGCEITWPSPYTTLSVSAGFLYIDGEICKVDAHTIDTSAAISAEGNAEDAWQESGFYWDIEEVNDSESSREIEDTGGTINVRKLRTAKVFSNYPDGYPSGKQRAYWNENGVEMKGLYARIQEGLNAL